MKKKLSNDIYQTFYLSQFSTFVSHTCDPKFTKLQNPAPPTLIKMAMHLKDYNDKRSNVT